MEPIIYPAEEFQYATVSLSLAPTNVNSIFAYLHIGKNFVEKFTNISYRIHDIVRVTSSSSRHIANLCLQFFDTSSSLTPPTDSSLSEYEPIYTTFFFADTNYIVNNNNAYTPIPLPTHPTRKLRRISMLKAKINSNEFQMPMSIASALIHPKASDFMTAFVSEIASLRDMNTFIPYNDNINLIPKGSLLSS